MSSAAADTRPPISVMVFTLNEEIHLPLCLEALRWCDDVIVVDSFSTDGTREVCEAAGVRFYQHPFEGFGSQRNWAFDSIETRYPWILILDADERVTPELVGEMTQELPAADDGIAAFRLKRRFYMWGRWLRYSSLYPTWVVRLVRQGRVRYLNRGHAETQEVQGRIEELACDLIDENLKGIDEWFERQNRYSRKEADYELVAAREISPSSLLLGSPLERRAAVKRFASRLPARGLLYFFYAYFWRRGFLDGRDGYVFCRMRATYQSMVSIKRYDAQRRLHQAVRLK